MIMEPIPSGGLETSIVGEVLRYGIVGLVAVVFGLVIRFLYREGKDDRTKMEAERKIWAAEREALKADNAKCLEACKTEKETMKADYERRNKETLEGYSHQLVQERDAGRKREDDIRREMTVFIERIAHQYQESNEDLSTMLAKLHDKLVK